MTKAQEWLNSKYTDKNNVKTIDSEEQKLEGELEIKDFSDLETISLSSSKEITTITIGNCPNIKYLHLGNNKITDLKWLDDKSRSKVRVLEIGENQITDPDIGEKFPNIVELVCFDNPIKDGVANFTIGQKIMFFNGGLDEFNSDHKILFSTEKDYKKKLVESAKELGIEEKDLENKKIDEIEKVIKGKTDELKKGNKTNKENMEKIKKEFPNIINEEGKVNEEELKKLQKEVQLLRKMLRKKLTPEKTLEQVQVPPKQG